MNKRNSLWLGSEDSCLQVLQAEKYKLEHPTGGEASTELRGSPFANEDEDDEGAETGFDSYLIQQEGEVGIININGPLVAEDSWINQLFGLVAYSEIARALQELVEDPDIKRILLNLDTGGGSASGLEAASDAIAWAREYKEVDSHTSGAMFSAGYWLGASAKTISSTRMAETGSIGVLIVHASMYQHLKDHGIEYTIIRAGKYKALGHPAEELSEEAKGILQGKADTLYSFFLGHVSNHRPTLSIATKEAWAEGKTFFGHEALELGVVDELTTLSERVEKLETIDKLHRQTNNTSSGYSTEEQQMPKPTKTVVLRNKEDAAALAAGAALEDLEHETGEVQPEVAATEAETEAVAAALAEAEAPAVQAAEDSAADTELVSFLKTQNAEMATQVASLATALAAKESEADQMAADMVGLREIALQSMSNMQIALSMAPIDMSELPASAVVAQHGKVRATFESHIKVGQQSRPMAGLHDDDASPAESLGILSKA